MFLVTWSGPICTSRCRGGTPGSTRRLGLGVVVGRGRVEGLRKRRSSTRRRWRVRRARGCSRLILGWVIFRIVHFPPFAEFLIATEAEMNKVSWTSKEDLNRATTVVLATVVLMAVFLFVVDCSGRSSCDDRRAAVRRRRRLRVDGLNTRRDGRERSRRDGAAAELRGRSDFRAGCCTPSVVDAISL